MAEEVQMARQAPSLEVHQAHYDTTNFASYTVEYMKNGRGDEVYLEICDQCKYIRASCMHLSNSWNEDGSILTCNFCGIDGT